MPTEAFFKLDDSKKQSILNSAIAEFSAQPYEKVSIFKIAQKANVSRSGFYYYFSDKQDLYSYLLNQIKQQFLSYVSTKGEKHDIFSFFHLIFDYLASCKDGENRQLIEKILYNLKPVDGKEMFAKVHHCKDFKELEYLCDLDQLKLESAEDVVGLTFMLSSVLLFCLQLYFADELDLRQSKERVDRCFDLLKHGVLK